MVERAKQAAAEVGLQDRDIELRVAAMEKSQLSNRFADVVISNCVIDRRQVHGDEAAYLKREVNYMFPEKDEVARREETEEEKEEFGELLKFTFIGFAGGLLSGAVLDSLGFQRSPIGQWVVRTLSGEGESIFEGIYSLRQRFLRATESMAEAYGWGKLFGMTLPWFIDWGSRLLGVNVYGVEGFYIPYFYAMSDQIGANISGLIFLRRKGGSWPRAIEEYIRHPVMLASLLIIFIVPIGLLVARLMGFSPTTQTFTALEAIASNLCWIPPLVGWLRERILREQ